MQIRIDPRKDFELFATGTLEGKLYEEGFKGKKGEDIEIIFIETSLRWRRTNNGPDQVIVNEYIFACLLKSVVKLINRGHKVEIKTECIDEV